VCQAFTVNQRLPGGSHAKSRVNAGEESGPPLDLIVLDDWPAGHDNRPGTYVGRGTGGTELGNRMEREGEARTLEGNLT